MLSGAVKLHPRQEQQRAPESVLVAPATAGMCLTEHRRMPQAVSEKKQKENREISRKKNVESNHNYVLKRGFDCFTHVTQGTVIIKLISSHLR